MSSKFLVMLIFASLIVISCLSCKQEEIKLSKNSSSIAFTDSLTFVGQLTKVGNEPFTKLGLIVNDSTVYVLECDENIANKLIDLQGNSVRVFAKDKIISELGTKIVVNKFEKIK